MLSLLNENWRISSVLSARKWDITSLWLCAICVGWINKFRVPEFFRSSQTSTHFGFLSI